MNSTPLTTEPAPLHEQLPVVALVGLLLFLSLALVYPSAAFPLHGVGTSAGLLLVLTMSLIAVRPSGAHIAWPLLLTLAWCGLWLAGLARAPVYAAGRADAITAILAGAAYLTAAAVLIAWPEGWLSSTDATQHHVPPLKLFSGWLAILIAALAAYGIYQVLGPASLPKTFRAMEQDILANIPATDAMRDGLLHAVRERRAASTLGAANIFASFCVLGVPVAAGCLLAVRRPAPRILYTLAVVLAALGVLFSQSNGGVLALIAAAALWALLTAAWKLDRRASMRLATVVIALLAALFVVVLAVIVFAPQSGSRWLGQTGMTQRLYYWRTAFAIWSRSPILGEGPGSFEIMYPAFRTPGSNETRHAHSWLLEYGASVGAAGLAVLALMLARIGRGLADVLANMRAALDPSYFILCGIVAGTTGLLAHGLIEYTLSYREAALVLFSATGVLHGATIRFAPAPTPPSAAMNHACRLLAPLPIIIVAVAVYTLQLPAARGYVARDHAQGARDDGQPVEALAAADRALSIDPDDPQNWQLRASIRSFAGDQRSIDDLQRAARLNPWSAQIEESIALHFAGRAVYTEAIAHQEKAVSLHPLDANHWLTLAQICNKAGRRDDAIAAFEKTRTLKLPQPADQRRRDNVARELGIQP